MKEEDKNFWETLFQFFVYIVVLFLPCMILVGYTCNIFNVNPSDFKVEWIYISTFISIIGAIQFTHMGAVHEKLDKLLKDKEKEQ